jgi:hypothetical protein
MVAWIRRGPVNMVDEDVMSEHTTVLLASSWDQHGESVEGNGFGGIPLLQCCIFS